MNDSIEDCLSFELETLAEMYSDEEVHWTPSNDGKTRGILQVSCRPMTGSGGKSVQFIRAELIIEVGLNYPQIPPNFGFHRSSGIGASEERSIIEGLKQVTIELEELPMLMCLIERSSELLTTFNTCGECSICLEEFLDESEVGTSAAAIDLIRTDPCWHRFHSKCLAEFWSSSAQTEYERQCEALVSSMRNEKKRFVDACSQGNEEEDNPSCGGGGGGGVSNKISNERTVSESYGERIDNALESNLIGRTSGLVGLGSDNSWRSYKLPCPACRTELDSSHHESLAIFLDEASTQFISMRDQTVINNDFPNAKTIQLKELPKDKNNIQNDDSCLIRPGDVFECVHYKGNHFRRKPGHFDSKVPGGYVPKGYTGVVAEWDGGDYIKPEGSSYWLALCGRSSGCGQWKMIHVERPQLTMKKDDVNNSMSDGAVGGTSSGVVNGDCSVLEGKKTTNNLKKKFKEEENGKKKIKLAQQRLLAQEQKQKKKSLKKEKILKQNNEMIMNDENIQFDKVPINKTNKEEDDGPLKPFEKSDTTCCMKNKSLMLNAKKRRQQKRHEEKMKATQAICSVQVEVEPTQVEVEDGDTGQRFHSANHKYKEMGTLYQVNKKLNGLCYLNSYSKPEVDIKGQWSVSVLKLNDRRVRDQTSSTSTVSGLLCDDDSSSSSSWSIAATIGVNTQNTFKERIEDENSEENAKKRIELNKRKELRAQSFSHQMFHKSQVATMDARLLTDYQTILDGHCKYMPNLLSESNDLSLCQRLAKDLYDNTVTNSISRGGGGGGGGMVEWSKHLKHENATWSSTFNEIVNRMASHFNVEVFASRLNFYRDGSDWKPFHHDSHAFLTSKGVKEDFTMGASFGDSRSLAFLHEPSGSLFALPQENGDVFAFTSTANRKFKHGVPKIKTNQKVGCRFSIIAWGRRRSLNVHNSGKEECIHPSSFDTSEPIAETGNCLKAQECYHLEEEELGEQMKESSSLSSVNINTSKITNAKKKVIVDVNPVVLVETLLKQKHQSQK